MKPVAFFLMALLLTSGVWAQSLSLIDSTQVDCHTLTKFGGKLAFINYDAQLWSFEEGQTAKRWTRPDSMYIVGENMMTVAGSELFLVMTDYNSSNTLYSWNGHDKPVVASPNFPKKAPGSGQLRSYKNKVYFIGDAKPMQLFEYNPAKQQSRQLLQSQDAENLNGTRSYVFLNDKLFFASNDRLYVFDIQTEQLNPVSYEAGIDGCDMVTESAGVLFFTARKNGISQLCVYDGYKPIKAVTKFSDNYGLYDVTSSGSKVYFMQSLSFAEKRLYAYNILTKTLAEPGRGVATGYAIRHIVGAGNNKIYLSNFGNNIFWSLAGNSATVLDTAFTLQPFSLFLEEDNMIYVTGTSKALQKSGIFRMADWPLSLSDIDPPTNNIMPYPNPGNGIFHLPLQLKNAGELSITITDAAGKTVKQFTPRKYAAGTHAIDIDISALPSGVYTCLILHVKERWTGKLLKE